MHLDSSTSPATFGKERLRSLDTETEKGGKDGEPKSAFCKRLLMLNGQQNVTNCSEMPDGKERSRGRCRFSLPFPRRRQRQATVCK